MLRIVFMGTPEFAVPCLNEIVNAGHEVAAVYCQPPRPAGRGRRDKKSPVHETAEALGLGVYTPKSLRDEAAQEIFRSHACDVAIVAAYGLILPKPILEAPSHGCLNLHPSALPRWRGAAPIQRTLMAGDRDSAVMIMQMEEGLDTGPICLAEHFSLSPDMTAQQLHDEAARRGADLMVRALAALERGTLHCTPQAREGVTYAEKIEKEEARIDWSRPAVAVHNHIRALSPFPGAWFEADGPHAPERIKVLKAMPAGSSPGRSEGQGQGQAAGTILDDGLTVACGEGAIRLETIQRAGRRPMSAEEFLRGFDLPKGTRLR